MKKLAKEIVQQEALVLREVALPLPEDLFNTPEIKKLIADMSIALDKQQEGVALAAPQVGVSYRLFIVRKDRTVPLNASPVKVRPSQSDAASETVAPQVDVYINPEIIKTSRKRALADEGCLSVRGVYGTTNRHERVTIKARAVDGSHLLRGAGGLMAQIFEHEIDHLNGILFTDHAEHLLDMPHNSEDEKV